MPNAGSVKYISRLRGSKLSRHVHTLRIATSYCAKGSIVNKNKKYGEDAAIVKTWITPGVYQGTSFVGVADGVGGWKRHGVDPSHLSQGLLAEMGRLFKLQEGRGNTGELKHSTDLGGCQYLLTNAFATLFEHGPRYAGGTTVCTGLFNPQSAEIQVLNLGDSGAWLIRDNEIIEKTEPDVHGWTPQQLTILPAWMSEKDMTIDLDPEKQTSHNQVMTWQLKPKDVLIFATDGFFDNVSGNETLAILSEMQNDGVVPKKLSDTLVEYAYYNSVNPDVASPFALRCLQQDEFAYWGGKPDDISLVVCVVDESELDFPSKL